MQLRGCIVPDATLSFTYHGMMLMRRRPKSSWRFALLLLLLFSFCRVAFLEPITSTEAELRSDSPINESAGPGQCV